MDVDEAVHRRRAYRVFDPQPVEEEKVHLLIDSMRLAPSCGNNQPWRVVLCSREALPKVKECLTKGNLWATTAPLIMVIAGKPSDDCREKEGRDYFKFGCGLAVGQMLLRSVELGLIAHPIAGYDPVKVREALDIPADYVVICLVICGYPGTDESLLSDKQKAQQRERPERKPEGSNFFHEKWTDGKG